MKSETEKKPKGHFAREHTVVYVVMLAGAILRIRQYLTGRSLWLDEAMLALNIVNRSFFELFRPLDYDQGAPIGFLMVEKVFNVFLGRNEYALRLFPLILGLLSLWTFYLVLKRFLHDTPFVIAVALFAFNPALIYYSSELKQYSMDVFAAITLLLLAIHYFEKPSPKRLGIIAMAGVLALWFSHPALFLLAGIGLTLLLVHVQKRGLQNLTPILGVGLLWLANVGFLYFISLGSLRNNAYMRQYWQDAFAPMPPWRDLPWYWDTLHFNADTHFAVTLAPWLLFVLLLAGWIYLLRQNREMGMIIGFMLFFTLLASSLKLYP
ncbi:MAG TPA: glycosyltransferase family 39 protein, partial [Anaerolineales bacterium]|nr:glycosyltransferase family 39 protein [Anaerolineales bacterium]